MSSPQAINPKKIILSTTEVSKLLLSKGRRKINESFFSHNPKTNNNIDITELTSQINIKMSKEGDNGMGLADQSMFRGVLEKSVLFKSNKALDRSGFLNNFDKFNAKDNLNLFSKLEKSQIDKPQEVIDIFQESKNRKKMLRYDTKDIFSDKAQLKLSYIINNYFPYDNEISTDLESTNKIKNYSVIFYFIIEKITFVLIKKFDKKLIPIYFWNREEDAKKFGIKYSQITTPGLYFKTFENFTNAFKEKISEREETIRLRNIIKESNLNFEKKLQNINDKNEEKIKNITNGNEERVQKMKNDYEEKIKEISNNNDNLNNKINEIENIVKLKDEKIKELSKNINDLKEQIKILRKINEKRKKENYDKAKEINKNYKKIKSSIYINNKNYENENEKVKKQKSDDVLNYNKFKSNNSIINYKKEMLEIRNSLTHNKLYNNNSKEDNYSEKKSSKRSLFFKNNFLDKEYIIENIIQIEFISEEISIPKLEEYFIENEEEDEVNKIKYINKIKTYGDKKSNESSENNNNFILYINDISENKNNLNNKNIFKELSKKNENDINKNKFIDKNKYDEHMNLKNQEILILKNKIESLNLEIQNKAQIIEELKYLLESKSNNNSNFNSIKDESSSLK